VPKPRILLVEDSDDDVALARIAFEEVGFPYGIEVASDGAQALRALRGCPTARLPAAVLLDLNLPKVKGLEVLRAIRADERLAELPVLVLTSSDDPNEFAAARDLGAAEFLRKPVEFAHFVEMAARIRDFVGRTLS
jgi:two-component system response regulator